MINEKKNRLKGIIGTILFHIGLLLLLLFLALRTPLPLPGEEGVLVNLGYDITGMGTEQQEQQAQPVPVPQPAPIPQETEEDDYLVQDIEEAPAIVEKKIEKKKEPEKVKPEPKPEPVKEEIKPEPQPEPVPQPNPKAMYKGKSGTTQGGQEGQTGQPGDQGDPSGTPGATVYKGKSGDGEGTGNGTGTGTGPGDGAGDGVSYDLGGRGYLSLPKPSYDSKEQGKVAVKIWVDKQGNVTKAMEGVQGSTTTNGELWKLAKDAALRSKFKVDSNAPEVQEGKITYNFIRQN